MPYISPQRLTDVHVHYIVGSNRSGTTLLTTVLNANNEVLSTPEVRFTMAFWEQYGNQNPVSSNFAKDLNTYVQIIYKYVQQARKMQLSLTDFDKDTYFNFDTEKLKQLNYANLCKLLLFNIQLPNKNYDTIKTIVDKNPDYTFYIKQLLKIYPDAKILVAMRDYRAVVLSQKESIETGTGDIATQAYLWHIYNKEIHKLIKQYEGKIMPVYYEQMVQQPELVVKQICSFLAIDFTPEMLNPQQKLSVKAQDLQKSDISERDKKKIGDLIKPINTSRLEAWKQRLTPNEITLIEHFCAQTGQKFGYQPTLQISASTHLKLNLRYLFRMIYIQISFTILTKYYFLLPFKLRIFLMNKIGLRR